VAVITPKVTLYLGSTIDVSSYVQSVNTRRGRTRSITHATAGTSTIVLRNEDRRFDPEYASGPYYGNIILKGAVKIYGTIGGGVGDTQIYEGTISSWNTNYEGPNASTVTVTCVDGLEKLSMTSLKSLTDGSGNKPPTFSSELSGTRVANILDCYVATADGGGGATAPIWPTGSTYRDVAAGNGTMQAKETTSNAWQELQVVANSEMSQGAYVSRIGKLVYKGRLTPLGGPTIIFSDDGSDIPYTNVKMIMDLELVFNLISLARYDVDGSLGGVPTTSSDATSQATYGVREFSRTGMLNTEDSSGDAEIQNIADYIRQQFKDQDVRFDNLVVSPNILTTAQQQTVLELEVATGIEVQRTPQVSGASSAQVSRDMVVDNVSHRIDKGNRWTTTFGLSPYNELVSDFMTINTGELGTGTIGF
jgi:hypothetical protein